MSASLSRALEDVLADADPAALRRATARLVEVYRSGAPPTRQVLADPVSAAAYAAYRMPATHAALSRVLRDAEHSGALDEVRSLVDVGGGTGAAAWAAADTLPGLRSVTVLDGSPDALALGVRLARHGPAPVAGATWSPVELGAAAAVPSADLATVSYVLGELAAVHHGPVLDAVAAAAPLVLVVEPGTPRGFATVLAARDRLVAAGWSVLAPCPQSGPCPVAARPGDWCHFPARLDRSTLHRRVKGAELGYEDEKYSYVLARRARGDADRTDSRPSARVLRHPVTRKGLVQLELCRADGSAAHEVVTRRDREAYRRARHSSWGERWE